MIIDGFQQECIEKAQLDRIDMVKGTVTGTATAKSYNVPAMQGWICPVCGRGLSPYTTVCPCKNGEGWVITCREEKSMRLIDADAMIKRVEEWNTDDPAEMTDTTFATRLTAELQRQGLSQREYADRAGLTEVTASRYARGERVPRASVILKTAEVLGVTCDYLVGLSDDPHKTGQNDICSRKTPFL